MSESCEESLMQMYKAFQPEAAGSLKAIYVFDISGSNGGKWTLHIEDGKCELKQGEIENPSVKISIADKDWIAIQKGTLNSQMAFMMGKLRVAGDMGLAMKLPTMFPVQA